MCKLKDAHLLGYTSEIYNPFLRFTFGDFFGDLSQYTLSQSLDGVQMTAKNDVTEIKVLAGFSQKADESRHFMRYVSGGRLETLLVKSYGFAKDWKLGFNFSDVEDDFGSIRNKRGIADVSNHVGSFNSQVLLWDKTDAEAELAKSWADEDTSPLSR